MARFLFCPRCGAKTTPRWVEGRERDTCPACAGIWYDNAKPCVSVLVEDAGRLLLVKRTMAPFAGCWDVPGGFLEADEHPEDGARRELREETGLEVALTGFFGVYLDTYDPAGDPLLAHHALVLYYTGRPTGGRLAVNEESSDVRWFAPDALPPLAEIAYQNGQAAVQDWLNRQALAVTGELPAPAFETPLTRRGALP